MKKTFFLTVVLLVALVSAATAQVTVSNSELDQVRYESLSGTLQPTNERGILPTNMSQLLTISGNGNGILYPDVIFRRDSLPVNSMVAGTKVIMTVWMEQTAGPQNTPVRFVWGLRRSVGLDTNLNSSTPPTYVTAMPSWQNLEFLIGTNGSPTWDEARCGVSFTNSSQTCGYKCYIGNAYILLPNQTTIQLMNGNGTLVVPNPPTGLNPNGVTNVPIPVCFDINELTGITYRLQVSLTSDFNPNNIVYDQVVTVWPHCVPTLQPLTTYYWRVSGKFNNQPSYGGWNSAWFTTGNVTGINPNGTGIPKEFNLYQNYPNPFNPVTNIRFDVPTSGNVKLAVYDITGKEVETLFNDKLDPGSYTADFDASALASGVYFYKLETVGFVNVKKMMLVK